MVGLHIMVDLETLGTNTDAHILSIGAAAFDKNGLIGRFSVGITPQSCAQAGLKIDAETVTWWLDQTALNSEAWVEWSKLEKVDLWEALDGFWQWTRCPWEEVPLDPVDLTKTQIWGNGATFDNMILRNAYKACGLEYPVPFYQDKCYRTLKGLAPQIKLKRVGTHHSAVDDAVSQAIHAIEICEHLGIEL